MLRLAKNLFSVDPIYAPTPLLVEAGSTKPEHPNAIQLTVPPDEVAKDLGLEPESKGVIEKTFGLDAVNTSEVEKVKKDLADNPPIPFDLARQVRVFNTKFHFVDLSLEGCFLSRKKAGIPPELLGLANDKDIRERLKSSFTVFGNKEIFNQEGDITETKLKDEKKAIEDEFLCNITGHGKAILVVNKKNFNKRVEELDAKIGKFREQVIRKINAIIEMNVQNLVKNLFPSVRQNPPLKWKKYLGDTPSDQDLLRKLENEIRNSFRDVYRSVDNMKLSKTFKGVTYEYLQDPNFMKAARQAFPNLDVLHEEYDAARQKQKD